MTNTLTAPITDGTDLWSDGEERRFNDALDVVGFAERGGVLTGRNSCESWHLDPLGRWVCGTRGTVLDSIGNWADDPERLVRAYLDGRVGGSCTPRWVIVDQRRSADHDGSVITEHDTERFLRLRGQLESVGIRLLDAVIFDDGLHWWSMSELLTGSTRWGAHPFPAHRRGS